MITNIKFCKICITPNTRPRIQFDKNNVCSICNNQKTNNNIDWEKRKKEFFEIVKDIRSKKNNYDCVVPFSGGKDSASVALRLKNEFKLNPLLVTYMPIIPTQIGIDNRQAIINEGFDHVHISTNGKISRHLSKRFLIERGDPKKHWNAGMGCSPIRIAVEKKIPAVFFAENNENEYGGRITKNESLSKLTLSHLLETWIGDDPINWIDNECNENDLSTFLPPDNFEKKTNTYFFGYFFPWDIFKNYQYVKRLKNYRISNERTVGTFTTYDSLDDHIDSLYYYLQYLKFGFGRCVRDVSRHINKDNLTRKKGLEYCKKYDGEYPEKYIHTYLKYYDLELNEFERILDSHREKAVWKFEGNQYKLRSELV